MGMVLHEFNISYNVIISMENLLMAWKEFLNGKRNKKDIQTFGRDLMKNILSLYDDLDSKNYTHSPYHAFKINDPKPRDIHKASVRDRLLHHAIYRILYSYFDKKFIFDSYSCRNKKGTHKAMDRFRIFARKVSKNNTKTCFVLKCDIRKFFASIDHDILIEILKKHIPDENIIWLLGQVVSSFHSEKIDIGLPLGNLTSQLFSNVYLNELDKFIKHKLKVKYYIRYADDFVVLSQNKSYLENLVFVIRQFLVEKLKLELHPDKIFIKTIVSGVDFLGWVLFSDHRVIRTVTKRRMFKKLRKEVSDDTINSYLGRLKWGNANKLRDKIYFKKCATKK